MAEFESSVPEGLVQMGMIDLAEAKRIQSRLEEWGVEIHLRSNPDGCMTRNCRPMVEAWVHEVDLPKVKEILAGERAKQLEGLEFDPKVASSVYDPDQETAQCPACGTQFSTRLTECPDCGLGFAVGPSQDG